MGALSATPQGCVELVATAGWFGRSGIYAIVHRYGGKVYIGSASCLKTRIGYHRSKLRNDKHDNTYLQRAWNAHGEAAFYIVVVEECPVASLMDRESHWMDQTRCFDRDYGYNLDRIAIHKLHSEETKRKIAAGNTGKSLSPATKMKISSANSGRKHQPRTAEQRERHRQAGLRQSPFTQAVRDKMSATRKGRVITPAWRKNLRESQKRYWASLSPQKRTALHSNRLKRYAAVA